MAEGPTEETKELVSVLQLIIVIVFYFYIKVVLQIARYVHDSYTPSNKIKRLSQLSLNFLHKRAICDKVFLDQSFHKFMVSLPKCILEVLTMF